VIAETASAGAETPAKRTVRRRKVKSRPRRRPRTAATSQNAGSLEAAIQFVQAAGGLAQAKAALETIERIRGL
jgi:hypothetical protein